MLNKTTLPISVVIPCFRCSEAIDRALYSVIKQTALPSEIILVDDASEDETLEKLFRWQDKHPNLIRILELKKNSGAGSARNAGWAQATQPYIAFLDADDSWHEEKLKIQYEYMKSHPEVALCGHFCKLFEGVEMHIQTSGKCKIRLIKPKSMLFKNPFPTPTVMIKRNVLHRFEEVRRYAEDAFLWQKIAFSGGQVVRLELVLAYVHKPYYGASGLSAHLLNMEKNELKNFFSLYRDRNIGVALLAMATIYSIIKFFRRIVLYRRIGNGNAI